MSAQTAVTSARGSMLARRSGRPARRCSHWAGSRSHPAPAVSAPLARQRCCQLLPFWSSSQSSSASILPRLRWPAALSADPANC